MGEGTGAHAAVFSALILASHRGDVWLGGTAENDDSFPQTEGGGLPADRMFRAAYTSVNVSISPSQWHATHRSECWQRNHRLANERITTRRRGWDQFQNDFSVIELIGLYRLAATAVAVGSSRPS